MKDGLRFVDSDMHVTEPPDRFDCCPDPRFKDRTSVPAGADGRPCRGPSGLMLNDGRPTSDSDLPIAGGRWTLRPRPAARSLPSRPGADR
jgi:hypothetical protein